MFSTCSSIKSVKDAYNDYQENLSESDFYEESERSVLRDTSGFLIGFDTTDHEFGSDVSEGTLVENQFGEAESCAHNNYLLLKDLAARNSRNPLLFDKSKAECGPEVWNFIKYNPVPPPRRNVENTVVDEAWDDVVEKPATTPPCAIENKAKPTDETLHQMPIPAPRKPRVEKEKTVIQWATPPPSPSRTIILHGKITEIRDANPYYKKKQFLPPGVRRYL